MMFTTDEPYFGGGTGDASVWEPHPQHGDLNNQNSKLSTWASAGTRGKSDFYDDASAKAAWNNGGGGAGSSRPAGGMPGRQPGDGGAKPGGASGGNVGGAGGNSGGAGAGGGSAWCPPSGDGAMTNEIALDHELMQLNLKGDAGGFPTGIPGQWGRQEVNQATPWNLDASGHVRPPFGAGPDNLPPRGFIQQPIHFDNESIYYRSWDGQGLWDDPPKGGSGNFGPGAPPFAPGPMPGQYGRMGNTFVPQQQGAVYGDRMVGGPHGGPRRTRPSYSDHVQPFQMRNGPAGFHHGHHNTGGQPWMADKFGAGGGGHHQLHHPLGGPTGGGRFPPFGHPGQQPGPPGGPPAMMMPTRPTLLPMQQPHHGHHGGVGGGVQQNFSIGSFQTPVQNDDSMWQDPNGELRKWQRDTGTAVWGDPAKQNSSEIRRWIQPPTDSDEENLVTPDPLREGKDDMETGWGPPPAPPGQKSASSATSVVPPVLTPSAAQPPANLALGGPAWGEGPRGPLPGSFQMTPSFTPLVPTGAPANGWGQPATGPAPDWTRSGPSAGATAFAPQQSIGGFEPFGQAPPVQDHTYETRRIAEKLRAAVSKGLLDMNLLVNAGANSNFNNQQLGTNTVNLLNTMLNRVTQLEALETRAKALEHNPTRKAEFDRLQADIAEVKAELQDHRERIHAALSQKGGPATVAAATASNGPRVSLADELTNLDSGLPIPPVVQPGDPAVPFGNEVGQLW